MQKNYIIIGDSITYGIGDFETNGWASMFKNYIVNKDDSKICNNYVKSLSIINDPYCKEIALSAVETTKGNKKPKVIG